jgi:energy-coupling factor transport system substrate-specific component
MSSGVPHQATGRVPTALVALVPTAIVLNIAINFVDRHMGLPLFLGRFGTVLAGALGGPWAGGLAGALSNVIYGLTIHAESIPYAVVNLAIGIFVGLVARWFDRPGPTLVAGFIVTLIGAVASASVGTLAYGATGNGTHFLTAFFLTTSRSLRHYLFGSEFLLDILDKVGTCYIVFFIIRSLRQSTRVRFGAT